MSIHVQIHGVSESLTFHQSPLKSRVDRPFGCMLAVPAARRTRSAGAVGTAVEVLAEGGQNADQRLRMRDRPSRPATPTPSISSPAGSGRKNTFIVCSRAACQMLVIGSESGSKGTL